MHLGTWVSYNHRKHIVVKKDGNKITIYNPSSGRLRAVHFLEVSMIMEKPRFPVMVGTTPHMFIENEIINLYTLKVVPFDKSNHKHRRIKEIT